MDQLRAQVRSVLPGASPRAGSVAIPIDPIAACVDDLDVDRAVSRSGAAVVVAELDRHTSPGLQTVRLVDDREMRVGSNGCLLRGVRAQGNNPNAPPRTVVSVWMLTGR